MIKNLLAKTKSAIRKTHYKRSANFYFLLVLLIVVGVTYYSAKSYFELADKKEIVLKSQHLMEDAGKNLDDLAAEYESLKESHDALLKTVDGEISAVFPELEEYTNLTRELDSYFKSKNTSKNPLVATNLQYGSPKLSEDQSYYVLPITMTISSSKENFFDFLDYIKNSGSLSTKTRIMDIASIQINFRDPSGGEKEGGEEINFNVRLNAYYQNID